MRLVYLQEGQGYGVEKLRSLCFGEEPPDFAKGPDFFERLADAMNRGQKIVRKSGNVYSFEFVGLFDFTDKETHENLTFFFWPKFVSDSTLDRFKDDGRALRDESRNAILLAIDRCHKEMRLPEVADERPEMERESLLELAVRVLRDYLENDIYTVRPTELEHNGQGEIDWNETIDRYQPVFLKGESGKPRPCYMDTATEISLPDENHYLTRLHRCLVTTWGRKLEELGLSTVLRVNVPLLSEDDLSYFGDAEQQIARIDQELGVQFVTKSRTTLKLMKELIGRASDSETDLREQLSFGMNKAEHLWEAACAKVLGSELDEPISKYGLEWKSDKPDESFRGYMPKPIWCKIDGENTPREDSEAYSEKSGWRLDFIRTWRPTKDDPVEKLVILDAKYYDVSWNEKGTVISDQPGIGDIAKQVFYQMAFEDLISFKRIGKEIGFVNAFLLPEDDNSPFLHKDTNGKPTSTAYERVHLGWGGKRALAFGGVNLFTIRLPGIELLRRYATGAPGEDWFTEIVSSTPKEPTP